MTDQSTTPVEGADASLSAVDDGNVVADTDFAAFEQALDGLSDGSREVSPEENASPDGEGEDGEYEEGEGAEDATLDDEPNADEETAEAFEDVEYEGKTYKLPRDIKDALLRQADYTRKTQEVAERRKALEVREAQLSEIQEADEQEQRATGLLTNIRQQIQQIENLDLVRMSNTHPIEAQQYNLQLSKLQRDEAKLTGALDEHRKARVAKSEEYFAQAREEGRDTLRKKIKGYTPELESKLADFGTEYGFEREEILNAVSDPRSIEILHLAYLGKQALQNQRNLQKRAQGAQTKPARTVRGGGGKFEASPDTNDFAAFERMANKRLG